MESKKQRLKRLRRNFRERCLERDTHKCVFCLTGGVPLDVHHITPRKEMPNDGYSMSNGISLCEPCHLLAEDYLQDKLAQNESRDFWSPGALYGLIGSSYEEALRDSSELR